MSPLASKLRFPVIFGSFLFFTYFGTKNFHTNYKDELHEQRKRINPEYDPEQDPEVIANLAEIMKAQAKRKDR